MKGGYKILDFNGYKFYTSTTSEYRSTKIDGIYDRIENSDKVFLVEGYNLDGIKYKTFFATFIFGGGTFITIFNDHRISISSNDEVVVTAITKG